MNTIRINNIGRQLMLAAALVSALFFAGCEKNNYAVDKDALVAPTAGQFLPISGTALRYDYYVRNGGPSFKIPVGITNVTNEDRVFNLTYSSRTAQKGVQYNAPASITIKAGTAVDTIPLQGIFAGYPTGRKDTIMVKFTDIKGLFRKDSFQVILQAYCDVVIGNLTGNYTRTREYNSAGALQYGPYTTQIRDIVSTGATKAEGYAVNLYDYGWADIKIELDWANPAAFKITVPLQATNAPGSGVSFVRSTAGAVNTFSSCDNTFTISLDLLDANQAVVGTGYQFRLVR